MVIVSDAILVQGRGANRLNAPNETLLSEHPESVVHGLARDRPNLSAGNLDNTIGGDVRANRDSPKDSEALGGDLKSV
jgi:hypothetical protein